MGNRALPATVALREQVLAAVREHGPVPTGEVPSLLGLRQVEFGNGGRPWCALCRTQHPDPVWRYPETVRVRTALVWLERAGLVDRHVPSSTGSHYWSAPPADDTVADLEALWETSPGG